MYCDYASTQKGNLNRHISTMHNEIIISSKSMDIWLDLKTYSQVDDGSSN